MNSKRYTQFLLESQLIQESSELAVENANKLNEVYDNMSREDIMTEGQALAQKMDYWANRLKLEERILDAHVIKYRDLLFDEEEL